MLTVDEAIKKGLRENLLNGLSLCSEKAQENFYKIYSCHYKFETNYDIIANMSISDLKSATSLVKRTIKASDNF